MRASKESHQSPFPRKSEGELGLESSTRDLAGDQPREMEQMFPKQVVLGCAGYDYRDIECLIQKGRMRQKAYVLGLSYQTPQTVQVPLRPF